MLEPISRQKVQHRTIRPRSITVEVNPMAKARLRIRDEGFRIWHLRFGCRFEGAGAVAGAFDEVELTGYEL